MLRIYGGLHWEINLNGSIETTSKGGLFAPLLKRVLDFNMDRFLGCRFLETDWKNGKKGFQYFWE